MLSFQSQFPKVDSFEAKELIESAFLQIQNEMQSGEIGYYKLPQDSLSLVDDAKALHCEFSQIVVVGIGGSSLGIKAIESILKPITPDAKEMIFFENSDPITISENISKIKIDEACFFIISKSGSTIETTSIFKTLIDHFDLKLDNAKNIFAITDEGSALSSFASTHNIKQFNIPHNVGGRFSVLSAVGVVPLVFASYDARDILVGAKNFLESFFAREQEHLLQKAVYLSLNAKQRSINVVFSYADRLGHFTKWYVQLWGESLGKIDKNNQKVGLTPIGIIGSVDQHSFLQLVIEGPRDKTLTFVNIDDFNNNLTIPNVTLKGIEKTDFINETSFNTLINEQCKATMQSVVESGVDADMITLDRISGENIGAMIIYYELLTSLVGAMFGVNTYNQPGVELGKEILYKNLGNN